MRALCWIFFGLIGIGVLGGCTNTHNEPEASATGSHIQKPKFPKDDLGREINLQASAKRVVCIGPGATETIFAIGAQDKLVGRDQISDYPKATAKIPVVGDFTGPFIEKVIATRPDLVIVQGETYDKVRAENWQQKIGAPVAVLVPTSVHHVAEGIIKIGDWLGVKPEAQKIASGFRPYLADRGLEGEPKAFFEVQRSPLWTAGKDTLIYSVLGKAGIANIAFYFSGYKQFSVETLLSKDPDLYIVAETKPDRERVLRELRRHRVLSRLRCVREGNVIVIPADWVVRPGPRLLQGIKRLEQLTSHMEPKRYP